MSQKQWNHGRHTGFKEGFSAGQRAGVISTLGVLALVGRAILKSRSGRREA